VTHEISTVFTIVDRVAMLNEGVVWADGTPSELFSSKDPIVRAFVGDSDGRGKREGGMHEKV